MKITKLNGNKIASPKEIKLVTKIMLEVAKNGIFSKRDADDIKKSSKDILE